MSALLENYRAWMAQATPEQKKELAAKAGLSYAYAAHSLGRPYMASPSVAVAVRLEEAFAEMNCPALPTVKRDDIAETCHTCPYAIAARRGN